MSRPAKAFTLLLAAAALGVGGCSVLLGFGAGLGSALGASPAPATVHASPQTDPLAVQVQALADSVKALSARVARLESAPTPAPVPVPTPPPVPETDTDPKLVSDYAAYLDGVTAGLGDLAASVDGTPFFDTAAARIRLANDQAHARLLADLKDAAKAAGVFAPDGTYRDTTAAKALFRRFQRSAAAGRAGK